MTNKLTCKMSDGTEWEVEDMTCTRFYGQADFQTVASLKPIKREPREGYALLRRSDKQLFMSREEAEAILFMQPDREDLEVIKVRQVIE
jgi:hypothetical protein